MKPLEPPDCHRLQAAKGWLELGNFEEAHTELDNITPDLHAHPDILNLRFCIYATARKWVEALEIARGQVRLDPHRARGWINRSNALHFLGRYREAFEELMPAVTKFAGNPMIPYNLACFQCRLGDLGSALNWLKSAFKIDPSSRLRLMAQDDPDLEPLWGILGGQGPF